MSMMRLVRACLMGTVLCSAVAPAGAHPPDLPVDTRDECVPEPPATLDELDTRKPCEVPEAANPLLGEVVTRSCRDFALNLVGIPAVDLDLELFCSPQDGELVGGGVAVVLPAEMDRVWRNQAQRLYRIAERCRRAGDFEMAENCYHETMLLSPGSDYARKAAKRVRQVRGVQPAGHFEEQEPPVTEPKPQPEHTSQSDATTGQAQRMYRIAERCRRSGDFEMAVNCYQETLLLSPGSDFARKAEQHIRRLTAARAEQKEDVGEEQETPELERNQPGREESKPAESEVDRKLKKAFGDETPEINRTIKLEIRRKGVVVAADECCLEPDGKLRMAPFRLAIFAKDRGSDKCPEIITVQCDVVLLTFDQPIVNITDLGTRTVLAAELKGNLVIRNNCGACAKAGAIEMRVDDKPLHYSATQRRTWTEGHVQVSDKRTRPHPTTLRGRGMELSFKPDGGTLERVTVLRDVEIHLYLKDFAPGRIAGAATPTVRQAAGAEADKGNNDWRAHVVIRSGGSFHYHVPTDTAVVEGLELEKLEDALRRCEQVHVICERKEKEFAGAVDQLLCDRLILKCRPTDAAAAAGPESGLAGREIVSAHATARPGGEVLLVCDSENLMAQGDELIYRGPRGGRGPRTVLKGKDVQVVQSGKRLQSAAGSDTLVFETDHARMAESKVLYFIGERCRRGGDLDMAYRCYEEAQRACPQCRHGKKALQRMRRIDEDRQTSARAGEEQETPACLSDSSFLESYFPPVDPQIIPALDRLCDDVAEGLRPLSLVEQESQSSAGGEEQADPLTMCGGRAPVSTPFRLFVEAPVRDLVLTPEQDEEQSSEAAGTEDLSDWLRQAVRVMGSAGALRIEASRLGRLMAQGEGAVRALGCAVVHECGRAYVIYPARPR